MVTAVDLYNVLPLVFPERAFAVLTATDWMIIFPVNPKGLSDREMAETAFAQINARYSEIGAVAIITTGVRVDQDKGTSERCVIIACADTSTGDMTMAAITPDAVLTEQVRSDGCEPFSTLRRIVDFVRHPPEQLLS